ncbi:hypothetical protein L584_14955 [Pantoea agglomerans Tx10]|jgi:hypothetical protein|nr:hypothetical protein L584_14955 [Pantoea agglomerans Tx10]
MSLRKHQIVDAYVRFVPEADIFFEPELAKFCQNQNR